MSDDEDNKRRKIGFLTGVGLMAVLIIVAAASVSLSLDDLTDVSINDAEVGDVLTYNDSSSYWENSRTAYGETYNFSSSGTVFDLVSAGVYENVTGLMAGNIKNFNFSDGVLTATVEGTYEVSSYMSFSGGSNNQYGFAVAKNYNVSESRNCYSRRTTSGTVATVGNVAASCIINLSVGDTLNLQIEDEQNPVVDVTIYSINLNARRIIGGEK